MFIKVLTLFSWIICFYLYESSITIPFHKRIDTLTLQTNPLKEKTHNYLECEIGIGTPKQTIKVLLEFYSNGIWIIQPDCGDVVMTSNLQNKQTPFYEHLSSTFKNQSRYFNKYREYRRFTRYSKAKQGYDTFSFGNENVEEVLDYCERFMLKLGRHQNLIPEKFRWEMERMKDQLTEMKQVIQN